MEWLNDISTSMILVGLIVMGVVSIAVSRRNNGQHTRSGDELWRELGRVHRLSWLESRRLRRAAEQAGLDPMALVFVEPHVLQQAIDAVGRQSSAGKRLSQLADQLYR